MLMNQRILITSFLLILIPLTWGCRERAGAGNSGSSGSFRGNAEGISIHKAALDGNSGDIDRILAAGANADSADANGRTPLMYAAFNGYMGIMEKLIMHGAFVNRCDSFGRTALMYASSGPFPEAVRLLLKNQADPNIADKEEHFTALMYAASEGQAEVVRILLTFNADPSMKDIDGDNALTFARNNGHATVADLLEKGSK